MKAGQLQQPRLGAGRPVCSLLRPAAEHKQAPPPGRQAQRSSQARGAAARRVESEVSLEPAPPASEVDTQHVAEPQQSNSQNASSEGSGGDEEQLGLAEKAMKQRLASGAAASSSGRLPAASSGGSSSSTVDSDEGATQPAAKLSHTQLIFKLERRGEGWAEEILPRLVLEQRVLTPDKSRKRYQRPDPWEEGSLEKYLIECGVPPDDVDSVVTQAVAWRVTPGGRPLIDRRRRSRVERNVSLVTEYLELECGVPFGPKGVGAIFSRVPELMLCKPTTNDRWDRRAIELAAYFHVQNHCNVPEDYAPNPELGIWVKRQRVQRAAAQLSDERLQILQSMGFEFGEVAQLTEDWEHRFDQLIDWMLWHGENQQRFSWLGWDWGARGGITARELALWVTLQKEYRVRGLLPTEALSRFEAIGMQWEPLDHTMAEGEWMTWFGRLLYVVERHTTRVQITPVRPKMGRPRTADRLRQQERAAAAAAAAAANSRQRAADSDDDGEGVLPARHQSSLAVQQARARLQQEMVTRRAALSAADLHAEPGLRFWLHKQRCLWRRRRLPQEQVLMLQLAGVDMNAYSAAEWQAVAHAAAKLLQGSHIALVQQRAGSRPEAAAVQQAPSQANEGQADGSLAAQPAGSVRMQVARWVETQQALYADGRLTDAQLRYLAFLGITWVLSEEVTNMPAASWQEWCGRLGSALVSGGLRPGSDPQLRGWLDHQRGLHALGWLSCERAYALAALGISLAFSPSPEQEEWDCRLGELLAFKAEHGHCNVPAPQQQPGSPATPLGAWLAEQRAALRSGQLDRARAARLLAIGALGRMVPAPAAAPPKRTTPPKPASRLA